MTSHWIDKPLADIGRALRSGKCSALDLFEEARAAHEKFGGPLSAYRIWNENNARALAENADAAFRDGRDLGPLQGIPVSVKDLFGVSHLDIFAGSPKALPDKWTREGPIIEALRNQGSVLTGKTHMVEFAFGGVGTNVHWPMPLNPWDAQNNRVAGGSSSGAGVSLMEGSALLALGSDTGGSVRVPASVTGTVGLKITAERWPLDGIVPLSPTLDTPGILTRSVADAALAFEVIDAHCARRTPRPIATPADMSSIRIGVTERHFWHDCPDDISQPVRDTIREFEKAGATVVTLDLPETEEAYALFRNASVVSSEFLAFLANELPGWADTLGPNVAARASGAMDLESEELMKRRKRMGELTASAAAAMADIDVLVSPTVPITAPMLDEVSNPKDYSVANMLCLRNTSISNLLCQCAITLPLVLDSKGIPAGLQCMAVGGAEDRLLGVALAFERQLGTGPERLGKSPLTS